MTPPGIFPGGVLSGGPRPPVPPSFSLYKVGVGGLLFCIFSTYRCSFERTKGNASRALIFSLLALAGVAVLLGFWVWLGGYLFYNISYYRCSFVTERTKGPTVSMRWTPTRGPLDPWTPREDGSVAGSIRPSAAPHP